MIRILIDGIDVGYVPFAYGHRLGANRYSENIVQQARSPPVQILNPTLRWPELPNSYPVEDVYILPHRTNGTRFNPDGHQIHWTLLGEVGSCSSTLADGVLNVGSDEGESFRLIGRAGDQTRSYDCTIERQPTEDFDSIHVEMKWATKPGYVECTFRGLFQKYFDTKVHSVAVKFNHISHSIAAGSGFNYRRPNRISSQYGLPEGLEASIEVPFSKLFNKDVLSIQFSSTVDGDGTFFVYSGTFEMSRDEILERLSLREGVSIETSFSPDKVRAEELFSTLNRSIDLQFMLSVTGLGEHVRFNIQTNKVNKTINAISDTVHVSYDHILAMLLEDESVKLFAKVTPVVDEIMIHELAAIANLDIEMPTAPLLRQGNADVGWLQYHHQSRNEEISEKESEDLLKKFEIELTDDAMYDSEHLQNQLKQIVLRKRFRDLAEPDHSVLEKNGEKFTSLLTDIFVYNETNGSLAKKRMDNKRPHEYLSSLFQTNEPQISAESRELTHLFPRQQFSIASPEIERSVDEDVSRTVVSGNNNFPVQVLVDRGDRLEAHPESETEWRSKFAFRKNTGKYTAPEAPGIYYLIEQDSTTAYVFEFEVHGRDGGDADE
jgi:hypothetical protein